MNTDDTGPLVDGDAGRLVRPYLLTEGRTEPSVELDLLTLVWSTREVHPSHVDTGHAEVLVLCHEPMSVAEISAHMHLPATVIRVLVSDLIDNGAVQINSPEPGNYGRDRETLEKLLAGLERRLEHHPSPP